MSAPRALTQALSAARPYERGLPIACRESTALLALLVRATEIEAHGTEAEMLALARELEGLVPAPQAPAAQVPAGQDPLLAALPDAEAAWLVAARARHAEYLRAVAEARMGQAVLTPSTPKAGTAPLTSTLDRQPGLWRAA